MTNLQERAMEIISRLKIARIAHAESVVDLAAWDRKLKETQAKTEIAIIAAAGGEKELGANVEARSRALTVSLADDIGYVNAVAARDEAELLKAEALAEVEALREELKVILAFGPGSQPTGIDTGLGW